MTHLFLHWVFNKTFLSITSSDGCPCVISIGDELKSNGFLSDARRIVNVLREGNHVLILLESFKNPSPISGSV